METKNKKQTKKKEKTTDARTEMSQPIIIELGKQRSKSLEALKNGKGKLWNEVLEVVEEVKDMLGEEAEGKMLVPLILIYENKGRRRRIEKLLFPLADWADEDSDDDENWDDED